MRATVPETLVDALEIRDTEAHDPSTFHDTTPDALFSDVHEWRAWTLKVINTLDQTVTLTVYGNFAMSTTGAGAYTDTLEVAAGEVGYITFHVSKTAPWTPWVYPSLQCTVAPTSGSVTVEIVSFDRMAA